MKLTGAVLKELFTRHGFSFKKSLGQNFLTDEHILNKIADDAGIGPDDTVLEVGPGAGTLTRVLSKRAKKVVAVEIDRSLLPILQETLADCPNVQVLNEDILKTDLASLYQNRLEPGFKLVANLPYYITTPILMRFLESALPFNSITVLVQREVAQRINAQPGTKEYGSLSCAVQYYTTPVLQTRISPGHFYPPPQVESQVITLVKRDAPAVAVMQEETLFKVMHSAFAMRRKTLVNNLMNTFSLPREKAEQVMADCGMDVRTRGEQLGLPAFAQIADWLETNGIS